MCCEARSGESMEPQLVHYEARDGAKLAYHHWPVEEPRGVVVYLHGIQSHAGWYGASCRRMHEAGLEVVFVDRRGSGVNPEARGDAPGFMTLLADLAVVLEQVRERHPDRPRIVVGISWGGKPAVGLAKARPDLVDALGLVCPGLFAQVGPPLWRQVAIGVCALVWPSRGFPIPLNDPKLFTDNPERQQFIAEDPLALRLATARLLVTSVRLGRYLRDAPEQIQVPAALFLAGRDRIIDNDRTLDYFERFASVDPEVHQFSEAHHTLEFAADPEPFLAGLVDWLLRTCDRGA